ncbi:xanthine dehydrogenase family protein [bacterium]|nr:xanthine dehydrogenase family protein [bacterium]
MGNISQPIIRVDALDKCAGKAKYIADYRLDGMIEAVTVRSTRPRARILNITVPDLPEGYYIVDKDDVLSKNRVRMLIYDQPFFADGVVNYIGEPIMLVVGPDREVLAEIASQVVINYEDIDPIFTLEDALSGEKPPIFGEDNLFADYICGVGDVQSVFEGAARIVEGEYRTGYQEQMYIETNGVIGIFENDRITVHGSMQCPYYVKNALAEAFGWDGSRIQVIQSTTGGAFGGKEEYPSILAGQAAFAAYKTGKPVRLILERTEDINVTTKRHPSIIKYRTAHDSRGDILAMDIEVSFDGGAYAGLSDVVLQRGLFTSTGVYNIPNVRIRGCAYATNTVPCGAFRGFGAPQTLFALEMHMAKIALEFDIEPSEFKKRYCLKKGDKTCTGGIIHGETKITEMMDKAIEMSGYQIKKEEFSGDKGRFRRGIGLSNLIHGCGFTGMGEQIISGVATLQRTPDGKVEILISNTEMGQGEATTMRKIVAGTLKLPIEDIICINPDTDRVPDTGPTVASRTTMIAGGLLEKAALELKEKWTQGETVEISKTYKHPAWVNWDQKTLSGDAYPEYSWGVNVVEVVVDTVTFEIELKKVWAVFDVGVAIDERMMRGQIDGGILQGLGYGSIEVMRAINGKLHQGCVTDYMIPTALDAPPIESVLIENPYEMGPFGAKCAGELTLVGGAPALALALSDALDIDIDEIPVTPEKLMRKFIHEI